MALSRIYDANNIHILLEPGEAQRVLFDIYDHMRIAFT